MYVVDVPSPSSLPTANSEGRYPVRRAFCVGRNYRDHAVEMGSNPDREPPFFFMKPADAVFAVDEGLPDAEGNPGAAGQVPYPPLTSNLHHEVELVVAIGTYGSDIESSRALDHVWGYGVGVDLTRRDLQDEAKATRRPWDMSKGFDASGPCSALVPASTIGHPDRGRIWLQADGRLRQEGDLADQIWPVADVVAHLSRLVTLRPGDVIFTGTPAGVGALQRGSEVAAGIDGVAVLSFRVV